MGVCMLRVGKGGKGGVRVSEESWGRDNKVNTYFNLSGQSSKF